MKTPLSKTEAKKKIDSFFKKDFSSEELKKIKRLAMKFNIKLKDYKKLFCRKCLNKLNGKIRITRTYKTVECKNCEYKNRFKI